MIRKATWLLMALLALVPPSIRQVASQKSASDPGVRDERPGAGKAIEGLTAAQQSFFSAGLITFGQLASVTGSVPNTRKGLGPTFNAQSCAQCHAEPAIGGRRPSVNHQIWAAAVPGAS